MAERDYSLFPHDRRREPQPPIPIRPQRRRRGWRIFGWIAGSLAVLLLVVVVAASFIVRSARFHDYVLKTASQKASAALNTPVHLQNFAVRISTLSLDLYGLTVEGTGPGANQPLLQAAHGRVGLTVTSLWHREWYVREIAIDQPVVKLIVDKNGETNLPIVPQSNSQSKTNVFDLGIRHFLLDHGEIYINDRKEPLYADLHDLRLQSTYDTTDSGRHYGSLGYRDGHLQYGTYAPIRHDLQAQFDARRSGMNLSNVTVTTQPMVAKLNANIQNYNNPVAHATYSITLDGGGLRRVMKDPSLPVGEVLINGSADYASQPNKPLLDAVAMSGEVTSRELLVRTPQLITAIRNLGAHYDMANGNAELRNVHANLLGGSITGQATVSDFSGKEAGHATLDLRNISLASLKTIASTSSLQQVSLRGEVNGKVDATWTGSMQNLVARADATVNSTAAPVQTAAGTQPIPLNGVIHALYNGNNQSIALNNSYISTPQTTLNLNGTLGHRSALKVNLQVNNLAELEDIADTFRTTKPGEPAPAPLGLSGRLNFNGTVTHSISAPELQGQLSGSNVQVHGASFKALQANLDASPSHVTITRGMIQPSGQGQLNFNLQASLKDWSFTPERALQATVNARNIAVAPFVEASNNTTPISGTLNANIDVHGSEANPIGHGNIALTNADISGQPIQAVNIDFQGTGDTVNSNLLVKTHAGNATAKVTYYPKTEGYDATLQATGVQLAKLNAVSERNMGIAGTLNLTASGRGTLKDPQGQASLTIPQLTVKDQKIADVNFQTNVANHEAIFNLASQLANTPLRAEGKVTLTGDYYTQVRLDTPVIALQPLLAVYAPDQSSDITGQMQIHATMQGPLKTPKQVEAHVSIPTLQVKYGQVEIAAVNPIVADYVNGVVTLQPSAIKGTDTDLRFEGRIPITGDAPAQMTLLGTIDLALLNVISPDTSASGQLQFDVNAAGRKSNQDVQGQIRVVNASFSTADAPLGLSGANGILLLRGKRLDVSQFTGKMGGGTVTASGGIVYRPSLQFDLALKGDDIRMLYPDGLRSDLSANLAMTGTPTASLLSGQVILNRLSFTPDFDLASFAGQFGGTSTPPSRGGFGDYLRLNIALRTTNGINAYSRTVSIQGDANLRVIGTANDPVIVGRANLTGGETFLLGNRYEVRGGTIAFLNTTRTEPVLNLQVNTTIQQYNIAMHFQGPIDKLHTNYTSDPSLPPADIINLIAFGKTQEAQAAQAQPGNLGAESALASGVTSQVTGRLEKVAGISHLSVDPVLAQNGTQNPGAVVTIQQRVTSKLYVTFSTDVTQTTAQQVLVQYRVNRKWSVSGDRDQNGGFGVDGRYHKDF
jgi:translocation and assembly module TamB